MSENIDVCVLLVGEGHDDWGIVGVTTFDQAEPWRLADTQHRAFMMFALGKIDDDFRPLPDLQCTVIESFMPAEGCAPVRVIIDGADDWDRRKAYEIIRESVRLYLALTDAAQHIAIVDPNWHLLEHIEMVIAAACGAVIQRGTTTSRQTKSNPQPITRSTGAE